LIRGYQWLPPRQDIDLLLQRLQEEHEPVAQPGVVGVEGCLRPPQGEIVAVLVFLDDPLQRGVGDIEIPGLQQEQRRQDPREPPVAVLERMDREEVYDENGNEDQDVVSVGRDLPVEPFHQFPHLPRGVEGRGRLEDDAHALPVGVERLHAVLGFPIRLESLGCPCNLHGLLTCR